MNSKCMFYSDLNAVEVAEAGQVIVEVLNKPVVKEVGKLV